MRVAVDFDGVLADTHPLIVELINFKTGRNYATSDWGSWYFWQQHGLDKEFWEVYDLFDNTNLRLAIRPMRYAIPVLRELARRGHALTVVTGNSARAEPSIRRWLRHQGLDFIGLTAIGRGHANAGSKLDLPFDVWIDDAPALFEEASSKGKRAIIFDQPWNRGINGFPRAKSWDEIIDIVENVHADA